MGMNEKEEEREVRDCMALVAIGRCVHLESIWLPTAIAALEK